MTQPPDWAINVPSSVGVHQKPAQTDQWVGLSQDQMRQLRQQLLESIVQIVVQAVTGLFVPGGIMGGVGGAVDQLEDWAEDLLSSFDDITGDLDDWIFDIVFWGGTGTGTPPAAFPLTFPFTFGETPNETDQFFYWIRKFTGIDDFDDLFSLNLIDLVVNFIETLLKPQDLLAWLVDGILPDGQAPQIVHDIIEAIVQGFAGIPIIGPAVQSVWDVIANLLGIGTDAQTTGTDNSGEIAAIKAALAGAGAGGAAITDYFDRVASTNIGSDYTQVYSGAGGGTDGTDGTGKAHWYPSGGSLHTVVNRHNTVLSTDTQYAAMVLAQAPTLILIGNYGYRSLMVRSNAAATSNVRLDVIYDSARLMAVVGGVETLLGQAFGLGLKPGDFWEILAGSTAEPYRFLVKLNGITKIDVVDSGHVSQIGASYRYPAFGATAGNYLNIIFFQQYPPMDVGAFSAADRTG